MIMMMYHRQNATIRSIAQAVELPVQLSTSDKLKAPEYRTARLTQPGDNTSLPASGDAGAPPPPNCGSKPSVFMNLKTLASCTGYFYVRPAWHTHTHTREDLAAYGGIIFRPRTRRRKYDARIYTRRPDCVATPRIAATAAVWRRCGSPDPTLAFRCQRCTVPRKAVAG